MGALNDYMELQCKLLVCDDMDGYEADALRDQMDAPWHALSEDEQSLVSKEIVALRRKMAVAPQMLALLEELETSKKANRKPFTDDVFAGGFYEYKTVCPICDAILDEPTEVWPNTGSHATDCRLAAALRKARGEA